MSSPIMRIDGNTPQDLSVNLDPALVNKVNPHGIPVGTPGHCVAVTPLISAREVDKIENRLGKGISMVSNVLLTAVDTSLNLLFDGAESVDRFVFKDTIDQYNGINTIDKPQLQAGARWLERGLSISLGLGGYHYGKSRLGAWRENMYANIAGEPLAGTPVNHLQVAKQGVRTFWGKNWPIASVIFLAGTGAATEVGKGIDLLDPDRTLLKDEGRTYARWASYGIMFLGSALLLNYPTTDGYRKIVAPAAEARPQGALPMSPRSGFMWASLYYMLGSYWVNWSTQVRAQTDPVTGKLSEHSMYNPLNWDKDLVQVQTEASHAIVWGFSGYIWAALHATQTKVTDAIGKKLFGFGSEVLKLTDAEQTYINGGKFGLTRGLRGVQMRLFTGRRAAFTFTSALAGLPMGVGIGQLIERASKYDSTEAKSGTPFRALITGPAGTAGMTFMTASRGYVRAWESYAFNMLPINWTWSACSKMGENLYQAARPLAEDYRNSNDEGERRTLRTKLFKLYVNAYDDGNPASKSSEKAKIADVLHQAGIDVHAIVADLHSKSSQQIAATPPAPQSLATKELQTYLHP